MSLPSLGRQTRSATSEWLKARPPIEKRQAIAKKKLAAINRTTALLPFIADAARVREHWQTMTLTRQQQIVWRV
jgi:hypothetical protein